MVPFSGTVRGRTHTHTHTTVPFSGTVRNCTYRFIWMVYCKQSVCPGAGPAVWEKFVLGRPRSFLRTFWEALSAEPWVRDHPAFFGPVVLENIVPVMIHGDEAEYLDDQKLYIISWQGGLPHGQSIRTRFLAAAIPSRLMVVEGGVHTTLQAVMHFVQWSLNLMYQGMFPSVPYDPAVDPCEKAPYRQTLAGQRLAGEYIAAFSGTKGDFLWYQHLYGFGRYWACNDMCWECMASKVARERLWTDTREAAGWRATCGQYCVTHSPFANVVGWHPSSVHKDILHILYVNGIANHLAGSCLIAAGRAKLFPGGGDSLEAQLHQAFIDFKDWCDQHGQETTHDGFSENACHCKRRVDFPWLGGKGADIKLVILWLADALTRRPAFDARATRVVVALATFTHILSNADVILTDAEVARARRASMIVVRGYVGLARAAVRRRQCLFRVKPKLHGLHHLSLQLKRLNPSFCSCWSDEDFMGRIAKIASKTHRRSVSLRVLERYLFQLSQTMRACAEGR
jgi:hypothetical protein